MDLLINIISKKVAKTAVRLSSLGFNEYAWNSENIIAVIRELNDKKISIFGGDVYKVNDNRIEITSDSWYINDDGTPDFYQKSSDKALEYIKEYEKNNHGDFIYSIVI